MSNSTISHVDAPSGGYVYRLESVWRTLEQYFRGDLSYRIFAPIDRIDDHTDIPPPQAGQLWCGLWFLTNAEDVTKFQLKEPENHLGASPLESVVLALEGRAGVLDRPMRLVSRISLAGFDGRAFRRDLPLIDDYPSSMFDLRPADVGNAAPIEGERTSLVTMPKEHIEVFYDGQWYPKRLAVGRIIQQKILSRRSAEGIVFTNEQPLTSIVPLGGGTETLARRGA